MKDRLTPFQLVEHAFNMPQLSVLTEMEEPRLWIPIPHMYGVSHPRAKQNGIETNRAW